MAARNRLLVQLFVACMLFAATSCSARSARHSHANLHHHSYRRSRSNHHPNPGLFSVLQLPPQSHQLAADRTNATASHGAASVVFNVLEFGAKGDGVTDDTKALVAAWEAACKRWSSAIVYMPQDKEFLTHPITFQGPCHGPLAIQIDGKVTAPKNPKNWNDEDKFWIEFKNMNNFVMKGSGILNGRGETWWSCVKQNITQCPSRSPPTLLRLSDSIDVTVENLNFTDSQKAHIVFDNCMGVKAYNLRISSAASSPNTDGIHVQSSSNVQIHNCTIATGDDCISIGNGTFNVEIKDITCGPGHGISIGSLGKGHTRAQVHNISLDGAILNSTRYGVRIKTWQGGSGYVRMVHFQNVRMYEVRMPIFIDQYYCTKLDEPCFNATSAVEISEVVYKNINGSSTIENAIQFDCSESVPCHDIVLENVDLTHDPHGKVQSLCTNASGLAFGIVRPPSCLRS